MSHLLLPSLQPDANPSLASTARGKSTVLLVEQVQPAPEEEHNASMSDRGVQGKTRSMMTIRQLN